MDRQDLQAERDVRMKAWRSWSLLSETETVVETVSDPVGEPVGETVGEDPLWRH